MGEREAPGVEERLVDVLASAERLYDAIKGNRILWVNVPTENLHAAYDVARDKADVDTAVMIAFQAFERGRAVPGVPGHGHEEAVDEALKAAFEATQERYERNHTLTNVDVQDAVRAALAKYADLRSAGLLASPSGHGELRLAQALRLIRDTTDGYPANVAGRALAEAGIEDPAEGSPQPGGREREC